MVARASLEDFDLALLPEVTGPDTLVAGVDEVGRGCLFGPVVAAALLLPCRQIPELSSLGVKDSKLLSPQKRQKIAQQLQEMGGIYRIGYAKATEIDRLNILQASLLAMGRSLAKLPQTPALCLVDGRERIPGLAFPQYALIKGDRRSPLIAGASILAKVWRDELLGRLAQIYPEYDLGRNKGYGTAKHCRALQEYGVSRQHRKSFRPCQVRHNAAVAPDSVLF